MHCKTRDNWRFSGFFITINPEMITHTKNYFRINFPITQDIHYTKNSLGTNLCNWMCVIVCPVSGPSRVSGLRAFLGCNLWLSCASPPLSWSLTVSAVVTRPGSPQHTDSKSTNNRPLKKRHPPKKGTKKRPQKRKAQQK